MTPSHSSSFGVDMNRIGFIKTRSDEFMDQVTFTLAANPWIKQIVSADLEQENHSIEQAVTHAQQVWDWVNSNVEGKFCRVAYSRAYGFELESDIVLFHLTWGKG